MNDSRYGVFQRIHFLIGKNGSKNAYFLDQYVIYMK